MNSRKSGFSLIEVLLTLFLLTTTLTGTIQLLAQAATLKNRADLQVQITTYLINRLEELKTFLPNNQGGQGEQEEEVFDSISGETFLCHWRLIEEGAEAWRIEIEVIARDHQEKRTQATLWVTPLLGF